MEVLREQFNEIQNYKNMLPNEYFDMMNNLIKDNLSKDTPESFNDTITLLMELNSLLKNTEQTNNIAQSEKKSIKDVLEEEEESIEDILQEELEFEVETLYETMPEYFYGAYSIHLPLAITSENVGVGDIKLEALIDTGAQTNIIYYDVVEKLGMIHKIYRQKMKLIGVGSQESEGFIPRLAIKLGNSKELIIPRVLVLKRNPDKHLESDMIIGINTMFYYGFNLNLKDRKLTIDEKELEIKLVDSMAKRFNF